MTLRLAKRRADADRDRKTLALYSVRAKRAPSLKTELIGLANAKGVGDVELLDLYWRGGPSGRSRESFIDACE